MFFILSAAVERLLQHVWNELIPVVNEAKQWNDWNRHSFGKPFTRRLFCKFRLRNQDLAQGDPGLGILSSTGYN
jgi:hypothetical protein